MVHLLPDAGGLVTLEFNTKRTALLITNLDMAVNVVITPHGGGGITLTLPPMTKFRLPDKIGFSIQGGTVGGTITRNFAVLVWVAGEAE